MYHKVILVGNLGRDPEMRYSPSGQAVTNFSIATSEKWTDTQGQQQERTLWWRVSVWGRLAETCNQYLKKGRQNRRAARLSAPGRHLRGRVRGHRFHRQVPRHARRCGRGRRRLRRRGNGRSSASRGRRDPVLAVAPLGWPVCPRLSGSRCRPPNKPIANSRPLRADGCLPFQAAFAPMESVTR
jgi:primosomal replication protein N